MKKLILAVLLLSAMLCYNSVASADTITGTVKAVSQNVKSTVDYNGVLIEGTCKETNLPVPATWFKVSNQAVLKTSMAMLNDDHVVEVFVNDLSEDSVIKSIKIIK